MKLLIFSDTHGRIEPMRSIIAEHADTCDAVLHLGDGAAEVLSLRAKFPHLPFYAVLGNNDAYAYRDFGIEETLTLSFGDKTLFLCHGDRFSVGGTLERLAVHAKARGADIALYGHTHKVHEEYRPADPDDPDDKPLWIFSPGSAALPRDSRIPSFAILDITAHGVLFSAARRGMR